MPAGNKTGPDGNGPGTGRGLGGCPTSNPKNSQYPNKGIGGGRGQGVGRGLGGGRGQGGGRGGGRGR